MPGHAERSRSVTGITLGGIVAGHAERSRSVTDSMQLTIMRTLYVYILECADSTFYTGVTNNVGRRFIEHISGLHEDSYTFKRRPLKLVFCREFYSPMKAILYEKQLKRWSKAKKEALIKNDIPSLHLLAECKNDTTHKNYKKGK
jgi:putative endonuclease